MTTDQYIASYTPRIPDLPHTAPAYDDMTKPKLVPYPAACVASKSRCKCYTQQATIMPTSDDLCRQIVERGYFVAWEDKPDRPVAAVDGPSRGYGAMPPVPDAAYSQPVQPYPPQFAEAEIQPNPLPGRVRPGFVPAGPTPLQPRNVPSS